MPSLQPSRTRPSITERRGEEPQEVTAPVEGSGEGRGSGGAGGGGGSDGVEDEGLGSETKVDRPPSAKGGRRRKSRDPPPPQPSQPSGTQPNQGVGGGFPQGQPLMTEDDAVAVEGGAHDMDEIRTLATRSPSPPAPPVQGLV